MWDIDHFPIGYVPWHILIRARFEFELDAVIGSVVVESVRDLAPDPIVEKIAKSAHLSPGDNVSPRAEPEQVLAAMSAIADYFEWCGTVPRRWPPRPRPPWFSEVGDPIASLVIDRAHDLVEAVGSSSLKRQLGDTLQGLTARGR